MPNNLLGVTSGALDTTDHIFSTVRAQYQSGDVRAFIMTVENTTRRIDNSFYVEGHVIALERADGRQEPVNAYGVYAGLTQETLDLGYFDVQ